jgi:hypothetical protein
MTYVNAFKEGFHLINRNWQLVGIQVLVMVVNCIGFFVVVALPIGIIAVAIGMDLEGLSNIEDLARNLVSYLADYMVLIMIGIFFLLIYLLLISVLSIYIYGASSGVIAYSIHNPTEKFSLKRFFSEGKRLFWPMFRYIAAILLVINAILIFITVIFLLMAVVADFLRGAESNIAVFISIFLILLAISIMLLAVTFGLAVTFYGTAILVFHGKGAFASLKEAIIYIYRKQSAYWFYCILLGGSIVAALILMLMGLPFSEIPVIGVLLAIPYQFFTYVVQSYLGLLLMSVIFAYYAGGAIAAGSSQATGISGKGASGQEGTHLQ